MMIDIPAETHAELRELAMKTNRPMRYLVNLFIKFGMEKLKPETLAKTPYVDLRGRPSAIVNKWEQGIQAAYGRLLSANKPSWRFDLPDFTREAGFYPSEALKGLRGLQTKGLMESMMIPDLTEKPALDLDGNPRMIEYWNAPRG